MSDSTPGYRDYEENPHHRPAMDAITGLLSDRIDDVGKRTDAIGESLQKHVDECARLQKWVLAVGCLTLGYLVTHSPEAASLVKLIAQLIAP